jgi:cell shape-determining protein MreC
MNTKKFLKSLLKKKKEKQKEYNSIENEFNNFEKAIGISFHETREKVLWEYMTKHLQSIKDMVETQESFPEDLVNEKIGDTISYLLILRKMLIKRKEQ